MLEKFGSCIKVCCCWVVLGGFEVITISNPTRVTLLELGLGFNNWQEPTLDLINCSELLKKLWFIPDKKLFCAPRSLWCKV